MPKRQPESPPYREILADLVSSVMRAQADLLEQHVAGSSISSIPDRIINRHFTWLAFKYPSGNRHLFDASGTLMPLRTALARRRSKIPADLKDCLDRHQSIPLSALTGDLADLVQGGPTRISQLIKLSFANLAATNDHSADYRDDTSNADRVFALRSPLSITWDYLTDPEMPGSRAFGLLALRNYLFETFHRYPDGFINLGQSEAFSAQELETALAHIWTSVRPRYNSRGKDTLAPEGQRPLDGLIRHFLAMQGVLWLAFKSPSAAITYCRAELVRGTNFAFQKSDYLDRFPELEELVNELWGLPIPIRGADTIFAGGLKFSSRKGLVMALHGGPGAGKTTLALAFGAYLAPMEIKTLFITAEEQEEDLAIRAQGLVPSELRRRSFYPTELGDWLTITKPPLDKGMPLWSTLRQALQQLESYLAEAPESDRGGTPKPCRAIVVLDGVHDLLVSEQRARPEELNYLREFVESCRSLQALVILTMGDETAEGRAIDYLVDIAIHLTNEAVDQYARKPDRRLKLTKARHQVCATGTHGFQIGGAKGVRFSPQISYQLERRSAWKPRLPEENFHKKVFSTVTLPEFVARLPQGEAKGRSRYPSSIKMEPAASPVDIALGSNIFLNGIGSNGKAALALKIAVSPTFGPDDKILPDRQERILVVSFLYPEEYYQRILTRLLSLRRLEYDIPLNDSAPELSVIHLYPGYLRPNVLFNRIEWTIEAAELRGQPFTAIIIDGIHNVYLQFPEINKYGLLWPQLYASLRTRDLTVITTHTTLMLPGDDIVRSHLLDDSRSEPLRHALIQKTDYRFDISSGYNADERDYEVVTKSAINQALPVGPPIRWSREKLVLFIDKVDPQQSLEL